VTDGYLASRFTSTKQQKSKMKTSTFITFLAFCLLSFSVGPSNAKGLKQRRTGMSGMGGMSGKGSPKGPRPPPSHPAPLPSPPAQTFQTCSETCERIVQKPFIQCNFLECVGNFECASLNLIISGQNGFKSQVQCSSYCVGYTALSCPQGFTASGNPTSRCLEARCIL
jgi:hypothetical protein